MANITLGIKEERTPAQLIDAARRGEISIGDALRENRLLKRRTLENFAKSIPYEDPETGERGLPKSYYIQIEKGTCTAAKPNAAEAIVNRLAIRRDPQAKEDAIAMLKGRYRSPVEPETEEHSHAGKIRLQARSPAFRDAI